MTKHDSPRDRLSEAIRRAVEQGNLIHQPGRPTTGESTMTPEPRTKAGKALLEYLLECDPPIPEPDELPLPDAILAIEAEAHADTARPVEPPPTFAGRDLSDEFWRDPMDVDADGNRLGPRSYRKTGTVIAEAVPFPFSVDTPEGVMSAAAGDYLVTDDPTTHAWPVKKDVFERTYVEVAPTPTVQVIYGDQPLPKPDTARPVEPQTAWNAARKEPEVMAETREHVLTKDCWCEPKVEYIGPDDAVLDECRAALIESEAALTTAQNDAATGRACLRNLLDAAAEFALGGGVHLEWEEQDVVRDAERFLGGHARRLDGSAQEGAKP